MTRVTDDCQNIRFTVNLAIENDYCDRICEQVIGANRVIRCILSHIFCMFRSSDYLDVNKNKSGSEK